jgi:MFS family permease
VRLLLQSRPFLLLWSANLFASLAGWALGIALSVRVFELTRSPFATSTLLIAGTLPAVLFGSAAGVVADRVNRVRLLQAVSLVRVAIVAALAVTGGTSISTLYLFVILQAAAMQLFIPAEQAVLADLIPRDDLPAAAGANSVATNVTRLVAPALGGALITLAGFTVTTVALAVLLTMASLLLSQLPRLASGQHIARSTFWTDLKHCLGEITTNRTMGAVATLQCLDACKEGALSGLYPVLMLGIVKTTPTFMGVVNSSFAVTAVLAGPLVAIVVRRFGYRIPIATGATLSGLLLLTLARIPTPNVAFATFLLAGLPFTISWVSCNTLVLITTPADRRARTIGTLGSFYAATMLFSAGTAGIAAQACGPIPILTIAASLQTLAGPAFMMMTRTSTTEIHPAPRDNNL